MTQFSNKLKTFMARELQRQFTSLDNSVGFFIANTATTPNGKNSIEEESKTRRQIQTVKLLDDDKVALMVNRVNWSQGTIYQPWSYTEDNTQRNFYVYTDENNVYACISAGGGRTSLEQPRGTDTSLIFLSNGYIWKFLFKIPENLRDFIDENYIPVLEVPFYENKPFPYAENQDKQLQYNVQYNTGVGRIQGIVVDTIGSAYPYVVTPADEHFIRGTPTVSADQVRLDSKASSSNDVYVDYTIRIVSGSGVGQYRKIIAYAGGIKTATLESAFNSSIGTPDATSKYEIIPTVTISGDGSGASAYAKMGLYGTKTIDSVVLVNGGSNYSFATASIVPAASPTPTALSVNINPTKGLGREPIFDLNVSRVSILTRLQGDEGDRAVIGNDYSQYGLWLSPTINSTYDNAGKVVGTVAYKQTKVDLSPNGVTFSPNFIENGEFVFGSQSYNLGRSRNFIAYGTARSQVTLDGLNSPFINGETVYVFKSNNPDGTPSGGFTFTNKTATVTNTLFQDSIRPSNVETYRCSHKLSIGRNDGNSFDPENPYQDITLDYGVTGASGSVGNVLYFDNIEGSSGDLYVTNVFPGSSSDALGFTAGELLYVNDLELTIESFSPPELNLFSGQLLYISSIDPVTRSAEQADIFKVNIDF